MQARRPFPGRPLSVWLAVLCTVFTVADNTVFAQTQGAGETITETAFAVPRLQPGGLDVSELPRPLPPSEVTRVRHILALQAAGSWDEAARETGSLESPWLLGSILAERYLAQGYRPSAGDLGAWLGRYGDQPEAPVIRNLLRRIAPQRMAEPAAPGPAASLPVRDGAQLRRLFVRNQDARAADTGLGLVSRGASDSRTTHGASDNRTTDGASDSRTIHGASDSRTIHGASDSRPIHGASADNLFAAGLAAWRLHRLEDAGVLLDAAYAAATQPAGRAAAAFWHARVRERLGDRGARTEWLRRAAQETPSFYGHLARQTLGPFRGCLARDTLGGADTETLLVAPGARRAFALLQIGDRRRAETELRALWLDSRPDPAVERTLYLVARQAGLTRLAADIQQDHGVSAAPGNAIRETIPRLHPAGGFIVDPPLVYAMVRRESNFQPEAVSSAGAHGLMQIMPATADGTGIPGAQRLHDPATNLAVGQRYLLQLAADDVIDGDLLRVLAAYAQGPNALRRWVDAVRDDGDPLMFLEAIPNPVVRQYVQETLMHAWRYADAFNMPAPSLNQLAEGRYPRLLRAQRGAATRPDCRS
jgi:soluble lytic murein transglycosylase